jgi:biotin-(acetyl-CoA carboxylase) ligase
VRWQDGEGIGAGVDGSGALLVQLPDGTSTALTAGEVTLRQG